MEPDITPEMSIFRITAYDKRKVVKIIASVDIVQSLLYIAIKAFTIVFTSLPESDQKGYPLITLLLAFIMCFYLIHMTLALKLLSALELEKADTLTAARNTKVWQNWAILYLIFLVGNCFANILSEQAWILGILVAGFGIIEILWRLVCIYNVGVYIDELLEKISYDTPTIKFFSVRFPFPIEYQDDLNQCDGMSQ
ncbi:unnamed protein product [Orchesella dallaii]|uniref:Uncharacterized protein n=1 Tax=Orchesella dallaii TaxID=48710 RepID=A0ABP1PTM7_9HEXA